MFAQDYEDFKTSSNIDYDLIYYFIEIKNNDDSKCLIRAPLEYNNNPLERCYKFNQFSTVLVSKIRLLTRRLIGCSITIAKINAARYVSTILPTIRWNIINRLGNKGCSWTARTKVCM